MLADFAFISTDVIVDYYALFLSENNPVRVWDSQSPMATQDVTYTKETDGRTVIKSGGDSILGYKYKCP